MPLYSSVRRPAVFSSCTSTLRLDWYLSAASAAATDGSQPATMAGLSAGKPAATRNAAELRYARSGADGYTGVYWRKL